MSSYTRDDFLALLIILEGKLSNQQIDMTDKRREIMIDALNMALGHQLPVFSQTEEVSIPPTSLVDTRHLNFSERKLLREIQAAGTLRVHALKINVGAFVLSNEELINIGSRDEEGFYHLTLTQRGAAAR